MTKKPTEVIHLLFRFISWMDAIRVIKMYRSYRSKKYLEKEKRPLKSGKRKINNMPLWFLVLFVNNGKNLYRKQLLTMKWF
jgi:hypothetical protein